MSIKSPKPRTQQARLIAILSQNYEMQQGRAQGLFVQARASMLLEVGGGFKLRGLKVWCKCMVQGFGFAGGAGGPSEKESVG